MLGKCFIVVGGTGSGKSTFVKEIFIDPWTKATGYKSCMVFDVNAEHGFPAPPLPEDFVTEANESEGNLIIFEEATIFFSHRSGDSRELRELLVRKRHKRNAIVFVFHSLRKVPAYVWDFVDTLFLKKTNDSPDFVKKKLGDYPGLKEGFDLVRKSEDKFWTETNVLRN
jgi:hypothetical protein